MIGWKVDVGYSDKAQFNALVNISQMTVLDSNKLFTIATKGDPLFPIGSVEIFTGKKGDPKIENAIQLLQEALGNDYFTSYGYYDDSSSGDWKKFFPHWQYVLPSAVLAYTNTNEYFSKFGSSTRPLIPLLIHFKSLNKLVAFYNMRQNTNSVVYSISENGALTNIGTFVPSNFRGKMNSLAQSFALGVYKGGNYNSPQSYYSLSITIGVDSAYELASLQIGYFEQNESLFLTKVLEDNPPPDETDIEPPNPFDPIDPSGPGGGSGAFDDESDLIPDSSLPTLSSANTGFTRIYNPTLSQVQDLAKYLWTDDTLIETLWNKIKQYFEDPMQAIIGFNLVPVPVPDAGSKNFALMYIDTGVSMNVAASQFVDRDCGTLKLEPYYGSALDYSPYTKVSAYLPFIGVVQLDVDEVMGRTLQVKYRVDICSGSCVAKILVDGNVLYQYSGHCAINIPFAASDFSSYVQAAISVAKLGVAAAVAAAGGPPPVGTMDPSQQTNQVVTTTQTTETARNPITGRQITTGTRTTVETREAPASQGSTQASFSALSPSNVSNTVGQIMSSKPVVNHSGSFSGNSGYLGVRRPYLIIERPNLCMPQNFQAMNGYPAMITMELSTCKGYTRVQQVQLTGLTATNPEQAEIQELLKSGVIF